MITPSYGLTSTERVLPRMALDFTTGVLDPRVTVARALNTATRVNASGFIEIVNANLPRFDYDPITLAPKGLLIEESRTNLLRYSARLEIGAWGKTRATVTANAAVAPDGDSTADKIVEDATASSTHFIAQTITVTAGTKYVLSAYVKADERNWFTFQLPSSIMGAAKNAFFDVSDGTIGTVTSGVTAAIAFVGDGWYRCSVTFTPTASVSASFTFVLADADNSISYTGDGTSGLFAWGYQVEAGAFATSYIPTTTTSLTRNADVVSMTGTNFSDWYNQTEGSFVFQYSRYQNTDAFGIVLETKPSSTSTANRFGAAATSTADPRFQLVPNGTSILDTGGTFGVLPVNTVVKGAFAYRSGDSAATRNGASPSNSATAFATPTYTNLQIGGTDNGLYGPATTSQLNGYIRQIAYYNTRLSNSSLQAITA